MVEATMPIDGVDDAFPLNPAQLGMLYHSLAEPGTGVYVGILDAILPVDLDEATFKRAWDIVIDRHDALRSIIVWAGVDEPLQVVRSACTILWEVRDGTVPIEDGRVERSYVEAFRREGIDLTREPAMRFAFGRLENGEQCFLWACHHALIDDWSQALVLEEVQSVYHSLKANAVPEWTPHAQIGDFADWLAGRDKEADEAFWRQTFSGFSKPSRLDFPGTARNSSSEELRGQTDHLLDRETSDLLRHAASDARVTLAALATGVWSVVLSRLTNSDDVSFGLAVTLRPPEIDGADKAIGNFVTTLPARSRLADHATLRELILHQHGFVQDAQPRSAIALSKIRDYVGLSGDEPVIDSILSFKQDALAVLEKGEGTLFRDPSIQFKSNFPIAVVVMPGDEIGLRAIYDPQKYSEEAANLVLSAFAAALEGAPRALDEAPHDLPIISGDELRSGASALVGARLPNCPDVVTQIREVARRNPASIALRGSGGSRTYDELVRDMNAIAARLVDAGLRPGDRVGLYLDRNEDVPLAMLGCLAAGVAYVPFDAAFPEARLDRMIAVSRPAAMITTEEHVARITAKTERIFALNELTAPLDAPAPKVGVTDDDTAYVMFTSGSTGEPKGVMVTHGNLAASTAARSAWYAENPKSFLLLSSHAFDSSVAGIYWTLTTGGTLSVPDADDARTVSTLAAMLQDWHISHTLCLPSLYQLLLETSPEALQNLQTVIVAGEASTPDMIATHRSVGLKARLVNEYGPTEATVWCAAADLTSCRQHEDVPIGGPVPGAVLRVLDDRGLPVRKGMPGELFVGGVGVAKGYFENEGETERAFVQAKDDTRLYRTGDIVYQRKDDALVYLRRADGQVKIRGYRVELSEIEKILAARPDVREAAARLFGAGPSAQLVGFVQAKEGSNLLPDDLAETCRAALPDYMIPAKFVLLDQMPRTPNGKIDRNALPEPMRAKTAEFVKPATPTESVLAELWRVALWLDREIGINEDFHDLGGHSLTAIRLLNDIQDTFGIKIPASSIGRITNVADQAKLIEIARREGQRTEQPTVEAKTPEVLSGLSDDDDARLAAMVGNWRAPAARKGFKIRVANSAGTLPPLFFCFLDEYSFTQLAGALGPDQPIFGIRASNGVIPMTGEEESEANLRRTALSYLSEVIELAGDGPIYLGGYCQGATIALNLASLLSALQYPIATMISIEKTPPIQYPGHVDIIFSEESFLNPYLQFDRPEMAWSRRYRSHTFELIPGQYQKAFQPQYLTDLASSIKKRLDEARQRALPSLSRAARSVTWGSPPTIDRIRPADHRVVNVQLRNSGPARWPSTRESGLRIRAIWSDADNNVEPDRADYADFHEPVESDRIVTIPLTIRAPELPGTYKLEIDIVEEGVAVFSKMGNPTLKTTVTVAISAPASENTPLDTTDENRDPMRGLAESLAGATGEAALRGASWSGSTEGVQNEVAVTLRNLGLLHLRNGRNESAIGPLAAALDLCPNDGPTLIALARVRLSQRRFIAARRLIWRAKRTDPATAKEAADLEALRASPKSLARYIRDWFRDSLSSSNAKSER